MIKTPTTLSVIKDTYTADQTALFSSYAMGNYSLCFEGLKIKYNDLENVMSKIMNYDDTIKRLDFAVSVFYDFYVLQNDKYLIVFDSMDNKKKININFYFHSYNAAKDIFDMIQSFQDKDDDLFVSISSFFFNDQKQIKANELIKNKEDFEYNSLDYYPYIETEEMFNQFMMSDSNILLLSGTPGTGKCLEGSEEIEIEMDDSTYKKFFSEYPGQET